MYTLLLTDFFIFRKCSRRTVSGQHQICFHIFAVFLSKHRANRFLLWWLFLHRRLRSRQRGSFACAPERLLLLSGGSLPKSITRFYPNNSKNLAIFLELSLSASIQGVIVTFFRLLLLSNRGVTTPLASPCIGQNPVGVFDCRWILHPFLLMSRRKYFKF